MASVEVVAGDIRDPPFHDRGRERLHRRAASCGADRHPLLLCRARFLCRDQRARHRERAPGRARWPGCGASFRPRPARSTARRRRYRSRRAIRWSGSPPTRPRKLPPTRWRCRSEASFDMPVVVIRPFNTFGPAAIGAGGDPDDHQPDRDRQAQDPPRRRQPDARFFVRHRHRTRPDRGPHRDLRSKSSARPSISAAGSRFRSARPRR